MRIKYNAIKGKRHKKGTIKVEQVGRVPIFQFLMCNGYWWNDKMGKWVLPDNKYQYEVDANVECFDVENVKQLVRHMKKHSKYLPKGTKFVLVSKFNKIRNIVGIL